MQVGLLLLLDEELGVVVLVLVVGASDAPASAAASLKCVRIGINFVYVSTFSN